MKKTIIAAAILLGMSSTTFAQTQKPVTTAKSSAVVKYTCPMHRQIIRNMPGKCPICGMKLVRMKKK